MKKDINAEIISVGSELLLGQIADTNAQWISQSLAHMGINVYFHHTVGDNYDRLKSVMELADKRSDLVIVTGGLGPTEDDLTREVGADILSQNLEIHPQVLTKVESFFERRGIFMTENNRKQALVFKDGKVFPNDEGMAPGMFVDHMQTGWIFLPGVPREMKSIFSKSIIPFLKERYPYKNQIVSRVLKFIGIGESILEERISDLIRTQSNPTIAPLAGEGEVTLRLTAKAETSEEALTSISNVQAQLMQRIGDYYYGRNDETLEQKVLEMLKSHSYTLASAESLTGGRFIDQLISVPGASDVIAGSVVSYQTKIKENVLHIPDLLIKKHGTVSEQCAREMAEQVQQKMQSVIGISFTGNAGPDSSEEKPVGLVYIGLKIGDQDTVVKAYQLNGSREKIRQHTVKKGLEWLFYSLRDMSEK
ncbi:competence/damage-inducible protein A [Virgibacillus sp. MSP4-1]|uniref:competence/damage-inducible protein A n=1 Tax=Virgibacillus sp. MSP4-1 TaxID=2700081 RepID=UPI0003A65C83|nr:competence/damage-inducible protein A [Virgibacillus sp. MSP4-1]QHS22316.1 competence/damage-inducible protein A [Virgibacillus sp. MSP4-1]